MDVFGYSVARDWAEGAWTITVEGELGLINHPTIRTVVQKCLADDPAAIIVDLRSAQGEGKLLLNLLATERRRGERQGVPIVYVVGESLAAR